MNEHSPIPAASADHPSPTPAQPSAESGWSAGVRLEAVANLAHELRTPVQVLVGYLDILREDFAAEISAQPRELLDRMNTNVHELAQTIENIMQFVLAEANAESTVDEEVTIRTLLADITPVLEAANYTKRLALNYDFSGAPDAMRIARRPLRSIMLNLALNAIKFTAAGSVSIAMRRARAAGAVDAGTVQMIEIEVSDTGPGLSPAQFERALKPFAQLSNTSARRYRGLGLGLAVVRRSVDLLGGRIALRSHSDHGSIFIVTLPLRTVQAPAAIAAGKAQLRRKPGLTTPPSPPPAPPRKPASGGFR